MAPLSMEIGRVVYSRAGRDAGSHYVVVELIDDTYVTIANGCLRKVDNPKKKKMKHLKATPVVLEAIAENLKSGKQVLDADVRKGLKAAGYADSLPPCKEG